MSTSDLGAVINFLVVGDEKYSAKIDTIGAALIDEGIWCATELGNRLCSNRRTFHCNSRTNRPLLDHALQCPIIGLTWIAIKQAVISMRQLE